MMINKIMEEKKTEDWMKDGGQYIPHAATWLNGRRWEDEGIEQPKGKWESMTDDTDTV